MLKFNFLFFEKESKRVRSKNPTLKIESYFVYVCFCSLEKRKFTSSRLKMSEYLNSNKNGIARDIILRKRKAVNYS